jgi:transglutaminase/protease-like cytokinesis protein 3
MIKVIIIYLLIIGGTIQAQQTDLEKIDYHRADSVANYYIGENLQNLPLLTHKLTSKLPTQIEQFRAIYTWVCTNIENDYWAFEKNKRNRNQLKNDSLALANWNRNFRVEVLNNLFKKQKTVCTGYAYLLTEMADLIDINCKIVDGYARHLTMFTRELGIPNHSWNVVYLNNRWQLCDATWSSGSFDINKNTFVSEYNDGYFLANPELFIKNHYPLDTVWILMEKKPNHSEFFSNPIIYKHAYKYNITPIEPRVMNIKATKGEYISFLLNVTDSFKVENIRLELVIGNWKHTIKPEATFTPDGALQLKYRFEFLGKFDIHIKYADKEIVTYTVIV